MGRLLASAVADNDGDDKREWHDRCLEKLKKMSCRFMRHKVDYGLGEGWSQWGEKRERKTETERI